VTGDEPLARRADSSDEPLARRADSSDEPLARRADSYEVAEQAAAAIAQQTGVAKHDVAVIIGSGWAPAAQELGRPTATVEMAQLPGFTPPAAEGHRGHVLSIPVDGTRILVLLGRIHAYEGHDLRDIVHPVRTAAATGVRAVVLTNAAGALRDDYHVGQPVLISDHLNVTGRSPLVGPAFVDMVDAYSPRLRALARDIDPSLPEGVYAGLTGPQYETPAEIRMLRALGADLVGMSTVHETIAARAAGLEVLGLSLVTNMAAGMTGGPISHDEVLEAGRQSATRMGSLLAGLVGKV
jgi:purine-nucleoside phosphorylase